jgi:hypothetical protein
LPSSFFGGFFLAAKWLRRGNDMLTGAERLIRPWF